MFVPSQGDCDRTFIYATLYITECLKRLAKCKDKAQGATEMYTLAISRYAEIVVEKC